MLDSAAWTDVDLSEMRAYERRLEEAIGGPASEGHSGQLDVEPKLYVAVAQLPDDCVATICEIGFNAGHSALRWLWAAPRARVIMFDNWQHKYSEQGERFIREQEALNPDRMSIVKGSSKDTVVAYHTEHPDTKCDLVSIDGDHSFEGALHDLLGMQYMANREFHVLFLDDTNCKSDYCVDQAMHAAMRMNLVERIEGFSEMDNTRGITLLRYTP